MGGGGVVRSFLGMKRGEGIGNRKRGKGERSEHLSYTNSRETLNLRGGKKKVEPSGLCSPNPHPRLAGCHAWEVTWTVSFSRKQTTI